MPGLGVSRARDMPMDETMTGPSRQSDDPGGDPPAKAHRVPNTAPGVASDPDASSDGSPKQHGDIAKQLHAIDLEMAQEADRMLNDEGGGKGSDELLVHEGPDNEDNSAVPDTTAEEGDAGLQVTSPSTIESVPESTSKTVSTATMQRDPSNDAQHATMVEKPSEPTAKHSELSSEQSDSKDGEHADELTPVEDAGPATESSSDSSGEQSRVELAAPSAASQAAQLDSRFEQAEHAKPSTKPEEPDTHQFWLWVQAVIAAAGRLLVRTGVSMLVVLNAPARLVPPRFKGIFNWFAISLAFWVPAVWLLAMVVSR